ncbi:MAG: flippase-like domain-containing protein [Bacteroidales bacterium]|nr:flippase-like domain-containing protein [Bacteroidales bacterium]
MKFRKYLIQALKFTGFLAAGLFLLWLAFRKVDIRSLAGNLREANYYWLLLSLLFSLAAFMLRARRWQLLIHPLGDKPSFWNTFHALMIGYMANLALPRIGEITRCVVLGKKEKIPVDKLVGTVIIERTIDFFSVLVFLVVILFFSSSLLRDFLKESIFIPFREKVLSATSFSWIFWTVLAFLFLIVLFILIRYRRDLRQLRFFKKVFEIIRGVVDGLKTITSLQRKWEFVFITILIWISYALMTWVVVFCLESTSHVSFWDSLVLLVVGGLAMSVPVQGGFGAFHYAISRVLIVMQGVSLEDGLTYALLSHESQILFEIVVGLLSLYLIYGRKSSARPAGQS